MKRFFTSFQYLCICFLCAITQNVFAQEWTLTDGNGGSVVSQFNNLESDSHDYDVLSYTLPANGDYTVVAPQGYHITSISFYYRDGQPEYIQQFGTNLESGEKYIIGLKISDNDARFLYSSSGTYVPGTAIHEADAGDYVVTASGNGYTIQNSSGNYLYAKSDGSLGVSKSKNVWLHDANGWYMTVNGDKLYFVRYKYKSTDKITCSYRTSSYYTRLTDPFFKKTYPFKKGSYTATVNGVNGNSAYTLDASHLTQTADLSNTLIDYVNFNISGLGAGESATYYVTLAEGGVEGNPEVEKSSSVYTSTLTPDAPNGDATPYFGIEVTPIKYNHTTNEITAAINQVCNNDLSHVLYVDMSKMNSFSDAETLLGTLKSSAAPNCLFFMPGSYKGSYANTIVGGANGTAAGDITVVDQQPFFTPYVFSTGSKKAIYERTGANGHVASQNTTLILPFDVPVANKGDLRFYTLSQIGDEDEEAKVNTVAYLFEATEVTGDAVANTPYQVKKEGEGHYTIQANNTTFRPTPEGGLVTAQNGSLTAYGNYTGVAVPKGEGILYFSQNYFWNSTTLTTSATHIKILPYRVYYKTSSQTNDSKYSVLFLTDDPEDELSEDFGNQDITAIKAMQKEDAKTVWYNMNGQKLNGRPTLPGVYVMNGKKVLIK